MGREREIGGPTGVAPRVRGPKGPWAGGPWPGGPWPRVGDPFGQWLGPPGVAAGSGPAAASFSL